jgi:hypothetical protein
VNDSFHSFDSEIKLPQVTFVFYFFPGRSYVTLVLFLSCFNWMILQDDHNENIVPVSYMNNASAPPSVVVPPPLIPSLKGIMTYSGGIVTCKGKWAMSDEQHEIDGASSEFEFKLIKADPDSSHTLFPINGKYAGWFLIKQAPPLKGNIKIEDKDMMMKFIRREGEVEDGSYHISGQGYNKLGKFTLRGTLTNDGNVHIYREYYQLTPVPIQQQKKTTTTPAKSAPNAASSSSGVKPGVSPRMSVPSSSGATDDQSLPQPGSTPRDGSGRIRKQSSLLKEFHDPLQKPIPRSTSKEIIHRTVSSSSSSSSSSSNHYITPSYPSSSSSAGATDRAHRLSPGLKKCADLLREISKLHQAQWFLEPVDPIKYNIPDYPKIIKNPMDFSTIRKNLENNIYDSINSFAEHMRLVFRNAITYNQARDSLVNIAARELSSKFEDKFRILVTQLDPSSFLMGSNEPGQTKLSGIKRSKSRDFSGGAINRSRSTSHPAGPRPYQSQFALPPAAVDGSTMKIIEMQQMIANMQDELKQLRTVVKGTEISKKLNESL